MTASPQATADYNESSNIIALAIAKCTYCKRAQAKAGTTWDSSPFNAYEDSHGNLRKNGATRQEKVAGGACAKHKEARRLNYVCSPVSETYWAS